MTLRNGLAFRRQHDLAASPATAAAAAAMSKAFIVGIADIRSGRQWNRHGGFSLLLQSLRSSLGLHTAPTTPTAAPTTNGAFFA